MSEHELWNELGNLYFLAGAYPQAVHAYNRSIESNERFGRPYSNLALTYVQQGKFDEAVDLYRRSLELLTENRERAISWNRLGNVYRCLRDYQQALVAYRRADELDPEHGEGRDEPGWLSEPAREGIPTNHGQLVSTTLPIPPGLDKEMAAARDSANNSPAFWTVAQPELYVPESAETREPASLANEINADPGLSSPVQDWPLEPETEIYYPELEIEDLTEWLPIPNDTEQDSSTSQEVRAEVEITAHTSESSENERQWEIEDGQDKPTSPVPDQIQARPATKVSPLLPSPTSVRVGMEDFDQSSRPAALEVVVEERSRAELPATATPNHPPVRTNAIRRDSATPLSSPLEGVPGVERAAEELRKIEAGIAKFKHVVQVNPRNAHAWDALGNLYKTAGLYKEALLAYQQAISNDPSKALYHHHLGLVYACEGRMEDAVDAFQRVIEIDPDHGMAHAALGGYYRKKGLEELAQKHVGKAMKSIFDSENEYNRACLAAICGNTDQALELLRVALKNKQTYVDWILRDPDLDFIRQDPRFKQLISDYAR